MRIAEASERCGISPDTLRYYERVGLISHVARTESGIRDYSEEDCACIQFIKCMRAAGMPIEALTRYLNLFEQGDETIPDRVALLMEQRELMQGKIAEMQAGLDRLNYKIAHYESCEEMLQS